MRLLYDSHNRHMYETKEQELTCNVCRGLLCGGFTPCSVRGDNFQDEPEQGFSAIPEHLLFPPYLDMSETVITRSGYTFVVFICGSVLC